MKKMFLVALLLGMGWLGACGQKLMVLGGSADFLLMKASRIRDSVQIDRSLLTVRYRFSTAHPSPDGSPVWCDILVQVGERYIKQTDLCLHYDCLIWTAPAASESLFAAREKAGVRPSNLFSEIVCDRESREMQVVCGDFFQAAAKMYAQPLPQITWRLSEEEQTVCGYTCRRADARFGGRNWTVWYAPEIPLATGPWKLNGLPGLILKATDNRDFTFDCVGIDQRPAPVMRYAYENVQDLRTLHNYLRYERSCYEHPFQTFANGEPALIVSKDALGKTVYLDESWSIPYNPIETEDE